MAEDNSNNNNNGQSNGSSGNTGSSNTIQVSTQVPGIDMTQIIASQPYMVKENSSKLEKREIKLDRA